MPGGTDAETAAHWRAVQKVAAVLQSACQPAADGYNPLLCLRTGGHACVVQQLGRKTALHGSRDRYSANTKSLFRPRFGRSPDRKAGGSIPSGRTNVLSQVIADRCRS